MAQKKTNKRTEPQVFGYLRVSTDMQDVRSQQSGVQEFADKRGWKITEYITDEGVSGAKDPKKRNLGPLLNKVLPGDTIIAAEISRFGRDLFMVMTILKFCTEHGIKIYTVKDNYILEDSLQSKVLAFAFGLAAEIERQMIRQRTKEGLAVRKKLGVTLGRNFRTGSKHMAVVAKFEQHKQKIIKLYNEGKSISAIARKIKVHHVTLTKYLIEQNIYKAHQMSNGNAKKREQARLNRKEAFDPYREEIIKIFEQEYRFPAVMKFLHEKGVEYTSTGTLTKYLLETGYDYCKVAEHVQAKNLEIRRKFDGDRCID